MEDASGGRPNAGVVDENAHINQPAAKKQRRGSKGMPPMDLNAPGLFNIVPQGQLNCTTKQGLAKGGSVKIAKQPPPTIRKPTFQLPPNVTVYPAHMLPPLVAPPLHPFSQPFAFPPQHSIPPLQQPMFSYTGSQALIPAPTFQRLIDVKINKLQHISTMRVLNAEEETVLKALLQLQKQKMMKVLDFMQLVLPEGQAKEDKPKRMLNRLERAGVKDGHVAIVSMIKRRESWYVCSALDGIPPEGISAVLRLLPGEGVSKPRKEPDAPPEERVEAVLPKPEEFEKLVRFMATKDATSEARRKCLLSFMCFCFGGKALHSAGYIHACNQVISAEKGTTLARKFQKAQRIDQLFNRKPGQGMKRKPEGVAEAGQGGDMLALPPPLQPLKVPGPVTEDRPLAPPLPVLQLEGPTQKKGEIGAESTADEMAIEGGLMRAAAADDEPGPVTLTTG